MATTNPCQSSNAESVVIVPCSIGDIVKIITGTHSGKHGIITRIPSGSINTYGVRINNTTINFPQAQLQCIHHCKIRKGCGTQTGCRTHITPIVCISNNDPISPLVVQKCSSSSPGFFVDARGIVKPCTPQSLCNNNDTNRPCVGTGNNKYFCKDGGIVSSSKQTHYIDNGLIVRSPCKSIITTTPHSCAMQTADAQPPLPPRPTEQELKTACESKKQVDDPSVSKCEWKNNQCNEKVPFTYHPNINYTLSDGLKPGTEIQTNCNNPNLGSDYVKSISRASGKITIQCPSSGASTSRSLQVTKNTCDYTKITTCSSDNLTACNSAKYSQCKMINSPVTKHCFPDSSKCPPAAPGATRNCTTTECPLPNRITNIKCQCGPNEKRVIRGTAGQDECEARQCTCPLGSGRSGITYSPPLDNDKKCPYTTSSTNKKFCKLCGDNTKDYRYGFKAGNSNNQLKFNENGELETNTSITTNNINEGTSLTDYKRECGICDKGYNRVNNTTKNTSLCQKIRCNSCSIKPPPPPATTPSTTVHIATGSICVDGDGGTTPPLTTDHNQYQNISNREVCKSCPSGYGFQVGGNPQKALRFNNSNQLIDDNNVPVTDSSNTTITKDNITMGNTNKQYNRKCVSCPPGFRTGKNTSFCFQNICTCKGRNGQPNGVAATDNCIQDNGDFCKNCIERRGFKEGNSNNPLKFNENGELETNTNIKTDNIAKGTSSTEYKRQCILCPDYYNRVNGKNNKTSFCQKIKCNCPNGTPAIGASCSGTLSTHPTTNYVIGTTCKSCSTGYGFQVGNNATKALRFNNSGELINDNGVPVTDSSNTKITKDNITIGNTNKNYKKKCVSCPPGFRTLNNTSKNTSFCFQNICKCSNGTPVPDNQCNIHDSNKCASCNQNHFLNNGNCSAVTICNSDEYQLKAPTSTSDRICKPLTKCNKVNEFFKKIAVKNSSNMYISNNECIIVDDCEGKFVKTAPTIIGGIVTKNSGCMTCKDGEYGSKTPNGILCLPCPPGTYSIGQGNNTSCNPFTRCGHGLMTDVEGTSKTNRTCKACPIGKTSNKRHNQSCPDINRTKCFCNNGSPLDNCNKREHNCSKCKTGFIIRKDGNTQKCTSIIEDNLCKHGIVKGKLSEGKSQCICNQGYFGGGSWDGFKYPKCIKKIQCKCPNGVAATNIPCGKSHTRNCPIIDNKGNLIQSQTLTQTGNIVNIKCNYEDQLKCESCNQGFKLTSGKKCEAECKNKWWDGTKCQPYTICKKDEYESKALTEKSDRTCKKIRKQCPPGETKIRDSTKTSDIICSHLKKQLKFAISKDTGGLKKCMAKSVNQVTFGLCHLEKVLNRYVSVNKLQNQSHFTISAHGKGLNFSNIQGITKKHIMSVLQNTLQNLFDVTKQELTILSVNGNDLLRIDVSINNKQKERVALNKLASEKNPLFLFLIHDIHLSTKVYITGISLN